jgi:SpoVK/Ycf46/Vps4 family AAA+-type ATPase
MAEVVIVRRLGVELLRLDLSKVVSRSIGDTEKHIDRVFAQVRRRDSD